MKCYLENGEHPCVYFNAWETDYHSDPIIAFTSEIIDVLRKYEKSGTEQTENIKQIKKTAGKFSHRLLPLLVKFLTRGAVDDKELANLFGDGAAMAATELFDSYKDEKNQIVEFKKALSTAVESLSKHEKKLPLVIFVDELDRCRPSYAIELLERIKHIFDIKNVVFVCSIEKRQLMTSLSAVYGVGTESNKYLKRFFDAELYVGAPEVKAHVQYLAIQYGLTEVFENHDQRFSTRELERFLSLSANLFSAYDADLRTREQCFASISIAIAASGTSERIHSQLLIVLIVLRHFEPQLYMDYAFGEVSGKLTYEKMLENLGDSAGKLKKFDKIKIESNLVIAKMDRFEIRGQDAVYFNELVEEKGAQTELGSYMHDMTRGFEYNAPILSDICRRLELLGS